SCHFVAQTEGCLLLHTRLATWLRVSSCAIALATIPPPEFVSEAARGFSGHFQSERKSRRASRQRAMAKRRRDGAGRRHFLRRWWLYWWAMTSTCHKAADNQDLRICLWDLKSPLA